MKQLDKKTVIIASLAICIGYVIALYVYPSIPNVVVSHWNAMGEPDGFMPKELLLFLTPSIALFLFMFFAYIPRIDPFKKNFHAFKMSYNRLLIFLILFLIYVHIAIIVWNIGYSYNMLQAIMAALAWLFLGIGDVLRNIKQNWFVGIRTPWTLSSEYVWERTHDVGGYLFEISGILIIFGILVPSMSVFIVLGSVVGSLVITLIYSYTLYKREQQ